jgi:hypothetical protein
MSLCYDFEKWTIISLALVAVSLTVGLVSLAYGYPYGYPPIDPEPFKDNPEDYNRILNYNELQLLLDYCYEHASDSANPVQDLVDKGLVNGIWDNRDCKEIKNISDTNNHYPFRMFSERR